MECNDSDTEIICESTIIINDKKKFKKLIETGDKDIKLIDVDKKSSLWSDFNFIVYKSEKINDLIYCKLCKDVFKFDKSSSSSQIRHNKSCKNNQLSKSSNKIMSTKKLMFKKLNKDDQKKIDRLTALAAAKDNRPHSFARGDGIYLLFNILNLVLIFLI